MTSLGRWCFRHRLTVILVWLILVAGLGVASSAAGPAYNDTFELSGQESTKALEVLERAYPSQSGDSATVVWQVEAGTVLSHGARAAVTDMLHAVARLPHVAAVETPFARTGTSQISADRRTAYATVHFDTAANKLPTSLFERLVALAHATSGGTLSVQVGGIGVDDVGGEGPSFGRELYIGLAAAALVLLLAFRTIPAMTLPLAVAIVSLAASLFLTGLLTHAIDISTTGPTLAVLIGLGVGVDYALFIVTRYRAAIMAGREGEHAAGHAVNSAGRAVILAGGTVCAALLGLLVLGIAFIDGMAIAAAVTVVVTVIAAITLLPALLRVTGQSVLTRKERGRIAQHGPQQPEPAGFWPRWAAFVQRRPAVLAIVGLAIMATLAIPFGSMRLGASDQGNLPQDNTARKAYDMLAEGFGPGFNGPLMLVAQLPDPRRNRAVLTELAERVRSTPGTAAVSAPIPNEDGSVAVLQVTPTTAPQDAATSKLIRHLRDDVVPGVTAGTGVTVFVGGLTAIFDDFAAVFAAKLPVFLAIIVLLGCLLLLIAFRSVVVPLTAAAMNLLAAAASFGVIVAIFQCGWDASIVTIGREGPIEAYLPAMMLAVLFGLSMDYQVFLVSRVHEEWIRTKDNRRAVTVGQADTGRVITAAAAIMILVFGSTALGDERVTAEFGVGLAIAVALDAFVLRTLIVPSVMHLLGRANWWLPRRLGHILPHVAIDPGEASRPS